MLLTGNAVLLSPARSEKGQCVAILSEGGAGRAMLVVAALLSFLSIVFSALVIASGAGHQPATRSLMFTENVATTSRQDYVGSIASMRDDAWLDDVARLVHLLAVGVTSKFRQVNMSLVALVLAIASAFVAMMV